MNLRRFRKLMLTGPAPWLERERKYISLAAGRDSNRIRSALARCGVALSRTTDRIPSDLGDMLECFRHFALALDSLTSGRRRPTKRLARAVLEQIRHDVYLDLDEHFSGLRRPLDKLIDELDEELRSRWDPLLEELEGRGSRRARSKRGAHGPGAREKKESFSSILASARRRR